MLQIIKIVSRYLFAFAFVAAGANHFVNTQFYLSIMPPVLPAPLFLVLLSGAIEMILGVLLLVPKFTKLAAWALILLLVAVFPANIYMALKPELFAQFSPTAIYWRLPVQFVLMAWAFWYTRA